MGKVTDRFPSRSLLISVKSTRAKGDAMKAQTSYRQRNPTRKIYFFFVVILYLIAYNVSLINLFLRK